MESIHKHDYLKIFEHSPSKNQLYLTLSVEKALPDDLQVGGQAHEDR